MVITSKRNKKQKIFKQKEKKKRENVLYIQTVKKKTIVGMLQDELEWSRAFNY